VRAIYACSDIEISGWLSRIRKMLLNAVKEQIFQPVTTWVKTSAELRLIQGRVVMCEMRFACACVNVRMRSDYIA
jgi:hypothetical protein